MDEKYFPEKIEKKWQERWAESKVFEVEADITKEKFYCLEMLPYPSGRLHIGHVRNYSIGDALSWYKRLQGFNVLHPIGWDSFGQPAEQAAIKSGVNPRKWTEENIAYMRSQLKRLGISYDWRREIAAHTPEYYKFDQWFFLRMHERGLTYKKMTQVNWCPFCQTTLSNEQSSGGVCWRCGNAVEKKDLEQWFVRITDYAEQLLNDMAEIESGWPEKVLTMQRNWIGRSEGAYVDFAVKDSDEKITVFTTRIDTIFGVNAIVLAVEHAVIERHKESFDDGVKDTIDEIRNEKMKANSSEEEAEKIGVATGLFAINPFNGEEVPIWVANYVLIEYGTGAVMSVPSGDQRDFEFSRKYNLPFRQIKLNAEGIEIPPDEMIEADESYSVTVNTGAWSGLSSQDAKEQMTAFAEKNNFGKGAVTYRLRDWGISRQRFWGSPIPIIYCALCGVVPVPEKDLPVRLPDEAEFTGIGESPLAKNHDFVNVPCPNCSEPAKRETDTMDTFVDSCWYYFRYCDSKNEDHPFDVDVVDYWTPVEQYIGGVEHAVMHLLYTRFWTKFMRDIGLVKFNEPVKNLMTQGMVVAETFYREEDGKKIYINPDSVEIERDPKGKITSAVLIEDKQPVEIGAVEKMSKSKNNGVDPDEMISKYSADAVRLFILFAAPVENDLYWKQSGIEGAERFLRRVYQMVANWREALKNAPMEEPNELSSDARAVRQKTHQTIARITHNFESFSMNTSVAALMELSNTIGDFKIKPSDTTASDLYAMKEALHSLIVMLTPFAPHFSEEMFEAMTGLRDGILKNGVGWPRYNEELAKKDEIEIPIQINGKLRSRVIVSADASQDEIQALALADEKVQSYTDGNQIVKVIVVPKRLVNVVVK
jgi:leucyl-tRNA synthetase